jgi:hypothetical protein
MEKWKNRGTVITARVAGTPKLMATGHKKNGKMENWLVINPASF